MEVRGAALIAAAGWLTGMYTRVPAGAFLVPTLLYFILSACGVSLGGWPWIFLAMAYGIMGLQIGGRFHPETIGLIRRVILPVIGTTLLLLLGSLVLAFLVARMMHLDFVSAYLAATPGGLDSVAAVATDLHVDTTVVVSMHLVRLLCVLLFRAVAGEGVRGAEGSPKARRRGNGACPGFLFATLEGARHNSRHDFLSVALSFKRRNRCSMRIPRLLNPAYVYNRRERIVPAVKWRAGSAVARAGHGGAAAESESSRTAALRDCHRGRRGFIVGNGPSLRMEDLDRLQSEISFGSNKIYLAFDKTAWRPTYYSVIDVLGRASAAGDRRGDAREESVPGRCAALLPGRAGHPLGAHREGSRRRAISCFRGTSCRWRAVAGRSLTSRCSWPTTWASASSTASASILIS